MQTEPVEAPPVAMRGARWLVAAAAALGLIGTLGATVGDPSWYTIAPAYAAILAAPLLTRAPRAFRRTSLWVGWPTLALGILGALVGLFAWIMPPALLLVAAALANPGRVRSLSVGGWLAVVVVAVIGSLGSLAYAALLAGL